MATRRRDDGGAAWGYAWPAMESSPRVHLLRHPGSGLFAAVAVERTVGGVAAGGIRLHRYADEAAVIAEAQGVARAMTWSAAEAGVPCGGAKTVVRLDGLRDRPAALAELGRFVEAQGGALYVGPDVGFTEEDRAAVASTTRYVDAPDVALGMAEATAHGVRQAIAAALAVATTAGLPVAIQGLGNVGCALGAILRHEGAQVAGYDVDPQRGGELPRLDEAALWGEPHDGVAPCALGGAIDLPRAATIRCRALVGAANRLLAPPEEAVAALLARRGIVHIPDYIANAGALILWAERVLHRRSQAAALVAVGRIGETTRELLARAAREHLTPWSAAHRLVEERLAALP